MGEYTNKETGGSAAEDATLIRQFVAGDLQAFDRLVIRHQDRVFSLCHRFTGDYQEAEDLAQTIFVKAFQSIHHFRFESAFSTWLYRIAVNTCRNRIKSWEFRFRQKVEAFHSQKGAFTVVPTDEASSPHRQLEAKERRRMIQQAVNELQGDKKAVLILRDMEGLSYDDISSLTGLKIGTVKSRIARARQILKKRLTGILL
ncbi:MAG: sigma-70 family RNA polymerase sigma factor [Desulfobacterales bacterium]